MRRLLLILGAVVVPPAAVRADPVEQPRPLDAAAVDAAVREAMKAWQVPGAAVAVVRDGETVYAKGFGVRSVDARDPVTPDTLFPIGSCSKSFTTTSLALLVDEGKVGWDDPVRKHLPWFRLSDPLADKEVRLRDLLCHRTGLAGHDLLWYRAPWGPEERVRRAGLLPLDRPFRSAFRYQSTMYTAAGLVVGAASGDPWDVFVARRLFAPLGMTSACCTTREAEKRDDRASGHRIGRAGEPEPMPPFRTDTPDAAGSVHASARDLAKWASFHLGDGRAGGKRLVSASALAETHTPQMPIRMDKERDLHPEATQMSYGLGWVVLDYRGQPLVAHGGVVDGFSTQITLAPRARVAIVVVCNLHNTRFNLALSDTLLDLTLGLPKRNWNALLAAAVRKQEAARQEELRAELAKRRPDTKPSLPMSAYAGGYENPAYGKLDVATEAGGLALRWHALHGPLEHFHFDTFVLVQDDLPEPTRVQFRLAPDGSVAALSLTSVPGAEFVRVGRKP
jgi:CubicO group peptidase (beta-lactamase class C family)